MAGGHEKFHEMEFLSLLEGPLTAILDAISIEREPRLGTARPDFIAHLRDGRVAIIEVKAVTPLTEVRIESTIRQLHSYSDAYLTPPGERPPELVLVVAGALVPDRVHQLQEAGISRVIDGPALRAAAPQQRWPEAVADVRPLSAGPRDGRAQASPTDQQVLAQQLRTIPPGRAEWSLYQRTVRDILATTWSPPLSAPLSENANDSRVNRRDIIFPNYATDGTWKHLRDTYEAHYVVVDAKNYVGNIKKNAVLQMSNYLSSHGTGLLGILVCRNAADRSAEVTRREQWVIHRKLIVVLNDDDLQQMLNLSADHQDAGTVVLQKIEDFRLGF